MRACKTSLYLRDIKMEGAHQLWGLDWSKRCLKESQSFILIANPLWLAQHYVAGQLENEYWNASSLKS